MPTKTMISLAILILRNIQKSNISPVFKRLTLSGKTATEILLTELD
jgi:hypothetical protein